MCLVRTVCRPLYGIEYFFVSSSFGYVGSRESNLTNTGVLRETDFHEKKSPRVCRVAPVVVFLSATLALSKFLIRENGPLVVFWRSQKKWPFYN